MESCPSCLQDLAAFDPELAREVSGKLTEAPALPDRPGIERLVEETFHAMGLSVPLGRAVALGGAELLAHAAPEGVARYWAEVREASAHGPELGQMAAEYLVPVIRLASADFLDRWKATVAILRQKGTYTLKRPLEAVAALLNAGEPEAATAFLDLLQTAFSVELTYNQSLHLTAILPRAALALRPARRAARIDQLRRVVEADFRLADDFIDGLEDGLALLDPAALDQFVTRSLVKWRRHPDFGRRMLALKTHEGREVCRQLQRAAALAEVRPLLGRYLAARSGIRLAIRPLADISSARAAALPPGAMVCSDGTNLYLPEQIDAEAAHAQNVEVFKLLVRMEAGFYEHGTYDFDLQKLGGAPATAEEACLSDLERFLNGFALPDLARDLFTIAEQTRLRLCWQAFSPGLWRRSRPLLLAAMAPEPAGPVDWLYRRMVFESDRRPPEGIPAALLESVEDADLPLAAGAPVEASAAWVAAAYPPAASLSGGGQGRLATPFGWRVRPTFFGDARRQVLQTATRVQQALHARGVDVLRSALVRRMTEKKANLDAEDLVVLIHRPESRPPGAGTVAISLEQLRQIVLSEADFHASVPQAAGPATWYPEWDFRAAGYLADHVRVVDRPIAGAKGAFYQNTLARLHELVGRMRRAFEWLRPEAVTILRPWVEGDEFDYRALIDYAVDRQAGITPSDRLYIKRVKSLRDVAVLLLVDLSRSTGNKVAGGGQTVVAVEKEAIVLFCEALKVVGDRFALAGFSGSGRLGVDYFHIKDFDQPADEAVARRIEAIAPQRSTRMGAAIRHATRQLAAQAARIRLLIVLGDGFPNDVDYKSDYAVADTRQAIGEARAYGIHAHAITVNLPADARLDDLYGAVHHSLIGEVRHLPDRLLSIYGRLTR